MATTVGFIRAIGVICGEIIGLQDFPDRTTIFATTGRDNIFGATGRDSFPDFPNRTRITATKRRTKIFKE